MTLPIAQLIHEPEGKTLEFKRDLSSPRPWLKTLVAFANSAGGRLIFGVADDRQIVGIKHPLDEEERLCNLIADSITPRLAPSIEMTTVEGKTLLMVEVYLSGMRPHFLKAEGQQLPQVTIEEIGMRVRFTVNLKEIQPLTMQQSRKGKTLHGTGTAQVGEQVAKVLNACNSKPHTKAELLEVLGLANVYLNYKRHLLLLIEQGFIEMTIPDKPNSRLQKYCITEKGRELLIRE